MISESAAKQKSKRQGYPTTTHNNGMVVTGYSALHPNCQGFVGNAFVSVLPRRCPLVRIRSLGHRPRAHGTTAQFKLATSPCRNVVRHFWLGKTKDRRQKAENGTRKTTPPRRGAAKNKLLTKQTNCIYYM